MENKKNKGKKYLLEFDMCGLCIGEVRNLLERAEKKEKVNIKIITREEDYLTHIEVLK
jgi:hypothetical protein